MVEDSPIPATLPLPRRFPTPEYLDRIRSGILLLLTSYECAQSVSGHVWDFALEIASLREAGMADNDFRWLTLKNYVQHAREVTHKEEDERRFSRTGNLCFTKRTCFVLTEEGAVFASEELEEDSSEAMGDIVVISDRATIGRAVVLPTWDADERELRIGSRVVKRFKRSAENQERILGSFQEEGWPHRIDDPIPPKADQSQRQRLRDAISSLNKHQDKTLIRFRGDGTGRGIIWELVLGMREHTRDF